MKKPIVCTCGVEVPAIEVFPGNICLECYEIKMTNALMPTAHQLTAMFRNGVTR